jgi:hypothetical protein
MAHNSASHDDGVEVLTSLLAEYADKLSHRAEHLSGIRSRKYLWLSAYGSLLFSAFLVDLFILKTRFFGISAVGAGAFAVLPVLLFLYIWESRRSFLIRYETKILSAQLKRIVDRASSTEDHNELSFAKRFELDLRMQDAEKALDEAKRVLSSRIF